MGKFINTTDFVGQYALATDKFTKSKLDQYIDENELDLLRELLGIGLYNEFIADYDGTPQNTFSEPRFEDIYEPLKYSDGEGLGSCEYNTIGIKKMLIGFIYFLFIRDENFYHTIGGTKENEQANAANRSIAFTNAYTNWNKSVDTYNQIQMFIVLNPKNYIYTKFNGQQKHFITEI